MRGKISDSMDRKVLKELGNVERMNRSRGLKECMSKEWMSEERWARRVCESNLKGRRDVGRPCTR